MIYVMLEQLAPFLKKLVCVLVLLDIPLPISQSISKSLFFRPTLQSNMMLGRLTISQVSSEAMEPEVVDITFYSLEYEYWSIKPCTLWPTLYIILSTT